MSAKQFALEMVIQLNLIRKNPRSMIADVTSTTYPVDVKQETINYLNSVTPCTRTVVYDPFLSQQSTSWAERQGSGGTTGHGDFTTRADFIYDHVGTYMSIGENLSYGFNSPTQTTGSFNIPSYGGCVTTYPGGVRSCSDSLSTTWLSPRKVVVEWVVDNGVSDKGHRKTVFNCEYTTVGIGVAPHKDYRVTVGNIYTSTWLPRS